jgi:hypothetical protein
MGFLRATFSCIGLAVILAHCTPTGPAAAPNLQASAVNQLAIAGNACGPTALLNALRFGAPPYQAAAAAIPGHDDRAQLRHIIIQHGGRRSSLIPQRNRWSRRGINAADLTDIANELAPPHGARHVKLILPQGNHALRATHQHLAQSLRRGFPPIISLRRYAGTQVIDSHFVTVLRVPDQLPADASSFSIDYLDPHGAKQCQGIILTPQSTPTPLLADFPRTPVGRHRAKGPSQLHMDALIAAP